MSVDANACILIGYKLENIELSEEWADDLDYGGEIAIDTPSGLENWTLGNTYAYGTQHNVFGWWIESEAYGCEKFNIKELEQEIKIAKEHLEKTFKKKPKLFLLVIQS